MAELFGEDPAFAADYLTSVLQDGEQADVMIALRQMAIAFGGVSAIAEKAQLYQRSYIARYRRQAILSYAVCLRCLRRWDCNWR